MSVPSAVLVVAHAVLKVVDGRALGTIAVVVAAAVVGGHGAYDEQDKEQEDLGEEGGLKEGRKEGWGIWENCCMWKQVHFCG